MTCVPTARLVLQDAAFVRDKLEHETGVIEWRLYWVLCTVLLRAVGHVLDKVDGKGDPRVRSVATAFHSSWKVEAEHAIFRNFIEKERNNILKQYSSSVIEGPVPLVAYVQRNDGFDLARQFIIEENLYRPIYSGEYQGEDGRTLLDEALEWWHNQLEAIEIAVEKRQSQTG